MSSIPQTEKGGNLLNYHAIRILFSFFIISSHPFLVFHKILYYNKIEKEHFTVTTMYGDLKQRRVFVMKYIRHSLEVDAVQYEVGKGLEDGFQLFSKVLTNGYIIAEGLVQVTREDGSIVCPFINNRRGSIFIREGDYIITEADGQRHVCGDDKFHTRFVPLEED